MCQQRNINNILGRDMHLTDDDFLKTIKNTPLISIDLVISDSSGRYLLGLRRNRPAADHWFVLGGRIKKGEAILDAFKRVAENELGVTLQSSKAKFIGVYEHFYKDSFYDVMTPTHYVVLAYSIELDHDINSLSVAQHSKYKWFDIVDLLASPDVHQYTKNYFLDKGLEDNENSSFF